VVEEHEAVSVLVVEEVVVDVVEDVVEVVEVVVID